MYNYTSIIFYSIVKKLTNSYSVQFKYPKLTKTNKSNKQQQKFNMQLVSSRKFRPITVSGNSTIIFN